MNIDLIVEAFYTSSFYDYSRNIASDNMINAYSQTVFETFNIKLDTDYLNFLKRINGFESNGLNFYGTAEQKEIYVLDAIKQNTFWFNEIAELKNYFIIGDGDMDFYCFSPNENIYVTLSKANVEKMNQHKDFNSFLLEIMKIYIPNIDSLL